MTRVRRAATRGWNADTVCDACDLRGGAVDPECATVCGADGTCSEYYDHFTGVWTCAHAVGARDPDCPPVETAAPNATKRATATTCAVRHAPAMASPAVI